MKRFDFITGHRLKKNNVQGEICCLFLKLNWLFCVIFKQDIADIEGYEDKIFMRYFRTRRLG